MESSLFSVLGLGLLLGLRHATDADHVVAVTTFVSEEKSLIRSCWIGVFWGIGHTASLSVAGVAVILLKANITNWLETRLELAVAVMLIVLGGRALYRTWCGKLDLHRHSHAHAPGAAPHTHWHFHLRGKSSEHAGWLHVGLRPLLVGIVHGAAGSGALMLLVLSTIKVPLQALLYIVVFGAGSVGGMLAVSLLLAFPLQWAARRVTSGHRPIEAMTGLLSCLFGVWLGLDIWQKLSS